MRGRWGEGMLGAPAVFQGDPVFHGSGLRSADESRGYHGVLHFGLKELLCVQRRERAGQGKMGGIPSLGEIHGTATMA